jgi:hypothetical protein
LIESAVEKHASAPLHSDKSSAEALQAESVIAASAKAKEEARAEAALETENKRLGIFYMSCFHCFSCILRSTVYYIPPFAAEAEAFDADPSHPLHYLMRSRKLLLFLFVSCFLAYVVYGFVCPTASVTASTPRGTTAGFDEHVAPHEQRHPFLMTGQNKQAPAAVILSQSTSEIFKHVPEKMKYVNDDVKSDAPAATHGAEEMKEKAEEDEGAPTESVETYGLSEDAAPAAAIAENPSDMDVAGMETQCSPEAQDAAMSEAMGVADSVASVEVLVESGRSTETPIAPIEVKVPGETDAEMYT